MTKTKSDGLKHTADTCQLSQETVKKVIDTFCDWILENTLHGTIVKIHRFGTFFPKIRKRKKMRNPRTQEEIDAPEMHSFLKLYEDWLPEFFADCHVTNGADYQYVVTYAIETQHVQDDSVGAWIKDNYLPELHKKMEMDGFPIIKYVQFRNWHDPRSGLKDGVARPRFSTGYTTLYNRPGLLIETHILLF